LSGGLLRSCSQHHPIS